MFSALLALAMTPPQSFYDFKMTTIEGKSVPLSEYKGKTVLVVNVASKCGLTPQYEGLEKLFNTYKDKDFVILGFPANDFRSQEPGTNEEIAQFCKANYNVTFPLFAKISVLGETKHPLYAWLLENAPRHEEVEWNFAKFLVSKEGKVIGRFSPKTTPEDPALVDAVKAAL